VKVSVAENRRVRIILFYTISSAEKEEDDYAADMRTRRVVGEGGGIPGIFGECV
jgi:hypothetical protein